MATALYLAAIWGLTILHVSAEWSVNSQYHYGWFVPLLVLYLVWLRANRLPLAGAPFSKTLVVSSMVVAAVVMGVGFLFHEANPEWRLLGWVFALTAIGITFLIIGRIGGSDWLRHFAFPVLFFLTGIPWPRIQESALMMTLMSQNAGVVAEVLHWFGHSAVVNGNVVEIAGGAVGVDEACSGIRSLQGALMMTLFLGELFGLRRGGRLLLVLIGIGSVLLTNAIRTSCLGLVGAMAGLDVLARWHDTAGYATLVISFCAILAAAGWLRRLGGSPSPVSAERLTDGTLVVDRLRRLAPWALSGLAVVVMSIAGTQAWFLWNERHLARSATWTVVMPREATGYRDRPISEGVRQELHFDEGESGSWTDASGRYWQASYFEWKANRNAEQTVLVHDPRVCLQAHGMKFVELLPDVAADPQGAGLDFEAYHFRDTRGDLYVFNCISDDVIRTSSAAELGHSLSRGSRWAAVAAGIRHLGQRRLEVGIWGAASAQEARSAFVDFLGQHLNVQSYRSEIAGRQ